eukprot:5006641-Amphidinium_carterae.2
MSEFIAVVVTESGKGSCGCIHQLVAHTCTSGYTAINVERKNVSKNFTCRGIMSQIGHCGCKSKRASHQNIACGVRSSALGGASMCMVLLCACTTAAVA